MNESTLLFHFGNVLRDLRKQKGLSQEDFALMCNLDRTYISGLERGKRNPTLKILTLIADKLDIGLGVFLGYVDQKRANNDQH